MSSQKMKKTFRQPNPPLNIEKELDNFNSFMVESISNRFNNKVLKAMNKNTVSKFEDAQIGNYAVIAEKLINDFKRSIKKQFTNKRLEAYIKKLYKRTDSVNNKEVSESIDEAVGVKMSEILKKENYNQFINAKSVESGVQIKKLRDAMMDDLHKNTLRLMGAGKTLGELYDHVDNTRVSNLNKAKLVSRNELKAFNQQLSEKRAKSAGVKKAIWRSVGDERSRKCHAIRSGKEFEIENGLYSSCDGKSLKPMEEVNCRCYAEYIIEF